MIKLKLLENSIKCFEQFSTRCFLKNKGAIFSFNGRKYRIRTNHIVVAIEEWYYWENIVFKKWKGMHNVGITLKLDLLGNFVKLRWFVCLLPQTSPLVLIESWKNNPCKSSITCLRKTNKNWIILYLTFIFSFVFTFDSEEKY